MVCKFGNIKEVACNSRHQGTDLGVVIVRERELLKVGEEVTAHVGFNLRAHNVSCGRHVKVGGSIYKTKHEIYHTAGNNEFRCERCNVGLGSARNLSSDKWENDFNYRCQRRAKKVEKKYSFVFFVIGQKSKK